ncbi:unnamed protein product [Sympodiomycopsis kandeliae]
MAHGTSATSTAADHQRYDSASSLLPSSSDAVGQRSNGQLQPEAPNKRRRMASLPAGARRVTGVELASAELEEHPDLVSASSSRSHARSLAEGYYDTSDGASRAATPARSRSRSRANAVAANKPPPTEGGTETTNTQSDEAGAPKTRGCPPGRRIHSPICGTLMPHRKWVVHLDFHWHLQPQSHCHAAVAQF